jgi:RNA polymerase sigma factor (sigma-70 family)
LEASTLQAPAVRAHSGLTLGASLLRLRSDEQLVALFRAGNDDAFRTIHDRYRQRLFAYTRQMLPGRQDAEDALQDVFVRAYSGLRANDREIALRAWLYRVAHNRCVDELRRPLLPPAEVFELINVPHQDPVAQADQRESLRRLIADVRRLPRQQRSALLMRELSGMSYAELADALETTVPAVKSLLVRARIALAQACEARDTSCAEIREELVLAQDRRVRPNAMARRHLRDCPGCRDFRHELRGVSHQLAALAPAIGPRGVAAQLLGFGFGSGASGGAAMGGTAAAGSMGSVSAVGTGGALASAGALATGAGHVATLLVATVVTAGGAVEIQHTIAPTPPVHHRHAHHAPAHNLSAPPTPASIASSSYVAAAPLSAQAVVSAVAESVPVYHPPLSVPPTSTPVAPSKPAASSRPGKGSRTGKTDSATAGTSGTASGEHLSSTDSTATGKSVVTSTSAAGATSTADSTSGSSTSTGDGSGQAGAGSASTNSTTGGNQSSAGASGSSSTGTSSGTDSGASAGDAGSIPAGQ